MVSLHIPAYNEPPELLIATIKAVEQIDYPNFEIVVIDNNTADPAVWGPVEEYCRGRERVRSSSTSLRGRATRRARATWRCGSYTDPRAEIIGLIDADDIVQPYYLRETVAVLLATHGSASSRRFEGNRDYEGSAYYTACVDSYQGFYLSVMSSRQRAGLGPLRRHDGPVPPQRPRGHRRLERVVHQ